MKVLSKKVNADKKTATIVIDWAPDHSDPDEFRVRYNKRGPNGPWIRIARIDLPVAQGREASRATWRDAPLDTDVWISLITLKDGLVSPQAVIGPVSVPSAEAPVPEPTPQPAPTPEPEPAPTPAPSPTKPSRGWAGSWGTSKAVWNRPVSEFKTHPESARYVDMLWNKGTDRPGNFNASYNEYTYPLFDARKAKSKVKVTGSGHTNLIGKEIPWDPSWRPSLGSDKQMVILDPDKGVEIDVWQVTVGSGSIRISNGSIVEGDYHTRDVGWKSSRGIGVQYGAMLVTADELLDGHIPHAGSHPVNDPDGRFAFPPATKVEHPSSQVGVPEGARFALKLTDADITNWLKRFPQEEKLLRALRAIAEMYRTYGFFITDTSGACSLQLEDVVTARDRYIEIGLLDKGGNLRKDSQGKNIPTDILDGLFLKERIYMIEEVGPRVTQK